MINSYSEPFPYSFANMCVWTAQRLPETIWKHK